MNDLPAVLLKAIFSLVTFGGNVFIAAATENKQIQNKDEHQQSVTEAK